MNSVYKQKSCSKEFFSQSSAITATAEILVMSWFGNTRTDLKPPKRRCGEKDWWQNRETRERGRLEDLGSQKSAAHLNPVTGKMW